MSLKWPKNAQIYQRTLGLDPVSRQSRLTGLIFFLIYVNFSQLFYKNLPRALIKGPPIATAELYLVTDSG